MACNGYTPAFQDQINSFDSLGPSSCTCYSGAMAGEYHTCGAKKPTGKRVRELTGDTSGGTTLLQVDEALQKGWDIDLDTRIGSAKLTWDEFVAKINAGHGAILQGSYLAFHGTKFDASPNFTGNHAIYVPPGWAVMDPLADGRRAGIYKYHGEVYPQSLIKKFAGLLVLDPSRRNHLGDGYVWCALTRDNTTTVTYKVVVKPIPPAKIRKFRRYIVSSNNIITGYKLYQSGGFQASCTAPKTYRAKAGLSFKSKRLVKLTNGSRKGWYVNASFAEVA